MMTDDIHSPHDHTFKRLLADKRVAIDFFKQYLPEKISALVNFEKFELCKESFINQKFKSSESDLLYRTFFDNKPGYLYLLVEHQSTIDHLMPFRLVKYRIEIIDLHRKQYPKDDFPIIYPIVFYHGKKPYSASTDFFDLFGKHNRELAKETFLQPFHLIDSWCHPERVFEPRDLEVLHSKTRSGLRIDVDDSIKASTLLQYIFSQREREEIKKIVTLIQNSFPSSLGEKTMNILEERFYEGLEKGIQLGRQEALEQGMEKEKRIIARRLLARGENIETVANLTDLTIKELKKLLNQNVALMESSTSRD